MQALLSRPARLAGALRRSSELLGLEVECLEISAEWILGVGGAHHQLHAPAELMRTGPLAAVREALQALPRSPRAPATLVALPSPATLAAADGGTVSPDAARATLQAIVRSLGELDRLAGVMVLGDDGIGALGRLLEFYQLTPISVRRPSDPPPCEPGALVALAVPLLGSTPVALSSAALLTTATLVTTEGPVGSDVSADALLSASRVWGAVGEN